MYEVKAFFENGDSMSLGFFDSYKFAEECVTSMYEDERANAMFYGYLIIKQF